MTEQSPDGPDPVMSTVGEAIGLGHSGDRGRARELLSRAWEQVGEDGDAMHRVGIAHSMADVQDDLEDELRWDLRALAAADQLTEHRLAEAGMAVPVAGFYPSLHLNLGEVYRKLGRFAQAGDHLRKGLQAVATPGWSAEPPDGYQAQVIDALARLGERLAGTAATGA
jgi:hypothetical protein